MTVPSPREDVLAPVPKIEVLRAWTKTTWDDRFEGSFILAMTSGHVIKPSSSDGLSICNRGLIEAKMRRRGCHHRFRGGTAKPHRS